MRRIYLNELKWNNKLGCYSTKRLTGRRARFLWGAIFHEDQYNEKVWNKWVVPNKPTFSDGRKYRLMIEEDDCVLLVRRER